MTTPPGSADHDLAALQLRADRRRQRYAHTAQRPTMLASTIATRARQILAREHALPARYALHLLIGILVPLAIVLHQTPLALILPAPTPPAALSDGNPSDLVAPMAPLALGGQAGGETPAPDSAFAAIDALPVRAARPEMLEARPLAATIAAEAANLRGGPGTDYDKLGDLPVGAPLLLLAQVDGWYQAQTSDGRGVWVAAELLDMDLAAADLLPQASSIPALPPARVGTVAEEGLNLRDGPGTTFVGMTKLPAGTRLDLLARYGDWFQVQAPDEQAGWVLGQYLAIGPGVVERVEAVTSAPDPHPALVGRAAFGNINLRGGPGVAYDKLGTLAAGAQLGLLGRYDDWFKIRAPGGAVGWVSSELLQTSDFIVRRVPLVRDAPAPPRSRQAAARRQAVPAPAASAGGVVDFAAQLVGSRYVWGGGGPGGFDCSGFTRYVYQQYGLDLPHSAAAQYSTSYGTAISDPSQLRAGDLVFFVNTYKRGISHVGIYAGGGDVVQAISPKQGVGVANIGGGYWAQHYYGAIRPSR